MICKFCQDTGCIVCPAELKKAQEKALEPIFVAREGNEHDMKLLKQFFGRESMERGFVPGVYGSEFRDAGQEMELRGALASLLQHLHDERKIDDEQ